ncbi:hypothetical protein [Actinomadura sediminis]|uniref:butyrate kinase n=1 Tax=Actinomadura sediminis TaxID=1038904 RepID=A0ABW3EFL8_9ACTN
MHAPADLAPLHQPLSLYALGEIRRALPDVPAVVCFDTAFHATIPEAAATYAIPAEWRERFRLRRYGFHGLSHAYAARRAAELLGAGLSGLRLVVFHLGSGASLCAVADGRSVDHDGITAARRAGDGHSGGRHRPGHPAVAAGARRPRRGVRDGLEHRSRLRALAGTGDMRELRSRATAGDEAVASALAARPGRACVHRRNR